MSSHHNLVTIESRKRFSDSIMWHDQKHYYGKKGIDAWTEDVPFYITSNPFIGHSYAKIMIRFMMDWMRTHSNTTSQPFTIVELGAGTGQFSFYLLKNLLALKSILKLDDLKLRYVMSDVTDHTFDFWEKHNALQPFLASGVLDFSVYDLYQEKNLILHRSGECITTNSLTNPLIVVANYLFDSIATDVFTVSDGQLYESLVTITADKKQVNSDISIDWKEVNITHEKALVENVYYHNQFDSILLAYREQLLDTHFQFPIAGLRALSHLQKFSNNQLLLLSSDKGYTNLEELDHLDYPELDFHGSFSVMVNYHAMGEYMKQQGGQYIIQAFRENIVTGVFSCGFLLDVLPELSLITHEIIEDFSPTDYFLIYEHFTQHFKKCSLEEMASYLNLSRWDPYVFDQVSDYLSQLAEKGDPEVVTYLSENMHKIAENFYYFPSSNDVLFEIGVFYQNISQFDDALIYYQRSLDVFGESDITYFNIGMCLYNLDHNQEALAVLKKALVFNDSSEDTREWIKIIEKEC